MFRVCCLEFIPIPALPVPIYIGAEAGIHARLEALDIRLTEVSREHKERR